jgi:cytochrome P450
MSTTTVDHVPPELIVDFDVFDPNLCIPEDTIQARVAEMAAIGPVVYSPRYGGHWVVTHFDEVQRVMLDPQTFSSYPNSLVDAGQGALLPLEVDPPDHTAYRNVLQPFFSPGRMKEIESDILDVVTSLIDGFIERGECEFVSEFAREVPAHAFAALVGLPLEDAPRFSEWSHKALVGAPGGTEEESIAVRSEVLTELAAYMARVIEERRGQPLDQATDVTSVVINTPFTLSGETRLLRDDELQRLFLLVMMGGLHTTPGSLAWGLMHLSGSPEMRQRLVDDPGLVEDAVEEILRLEAAPFPGRRASCDVELGGVQIKRDDMLLLALCAANRDGAEFPEPNRVSLDRRPNRHLSFGRGRHRCIGSHLARTMLRISFEEIHRRLPDYELSEPPKFHSSQTRGVLSMPIRFTPGPRSTSG